VVSYNIVRLPRSYKDIAMLICTSAHKCEVSQSVSWQVKMWFDSINQVHPFYKVYKMKKLFPVFLEINTILSLRTSRCSRRVDLGLSYLLGQCMVIKKLSLRHTVCLKKFVLSKSVKLDQNEKKPETFYYSFWETSA